MSTAYPIPRSMSSPERPSETSCPPKAPSMMAGAPETLMDGQNAVRDYLSSQGYPPDGPLPAEFEKVLERQAQERTECERRYRETKEGIMSERKDFLRDMRVAKTREYILGLPCIKDEQNSDVKEFFCGIVDGVGDDLHLLQNLLEYATGIFPEALASVRSKEWRDDVAEHNGGIFPTDARSAGKLVGEIGLWGILGKGVKIVGKGILRAGAKAVEQTREQKISFERILGKELTDEQVETIASAKSMEDTAQVWEILKQAGLTDEDVASLLERRIVGPKVWVFHPERWRNGKVPKEWSNYLPRFQKKVDKIKSNEDIGDVLEDIWNIVGPLDDAKARIWQSPPELQTAARHIQDDLIRRLWIKIVEIGNDKSFIVSKEVIHPLKYLLDRLDKIINQ